MTHNIQKTETFIQKALSGELSIEEASYFLSSLETKDRVICDAVHAIVHFLTDVDIRRKDKEYDSLMRAELENYVIQLKARRARK